MITNALFSLWGCGAGPLRLLQPHIRILSGIFLGCACLAAPLPSISGIALVSLMTLIWWLLSGMPGTVTLRCILAAVILFSPFLLLTPWMTTGQNVSAPALDRLANAGAIALRSTCCLFIAASTVASLSLHDAHRGLANLPLPRTVALLVIQLVTQTTLLAEETGKTVAALRIRAASGIRVIFAFPVVWMARILFRADRTAAAMTVRGYGYSASMAWERPRSAPGDLLAITASAALFVAAVLLRIRIAS